MKLYPTTWPKPIQIKPRILQSRITEQQKLDLYNRVRTTRDLALELGVHEAYLSKMFPTKITPLRRDLAEHLGKKRAIRKIYRELWGRKVLKGLVSYAQAADIASVSERTMRRIVKGLDPSVVEGR